MSVACILTNPASQMSSSVGDPDDPRSMKHKFHCVLVHYVTVV